MLAMTGTDRRDESDDALPVRRQHTDGGATTDHMPQLSMWCWLGFISLLCFAWAVWQVTFWPALVIGAAGLFNAGVWAICDAIKQAAKESKCSQ